MQRSFLIFLLLLAGCQPAVLHPEGPIGVREAALIADTFGIMMIVVGPVIFLTLFFAWRYRAGGSGRYMPNWARSWRIEVTVWAIPLLIVGFLGLLNWRSTHLLDPYRPLQINDPQLNIQVVALDWKWLFIYPDLHIASVNRMVIPTGTRINFLITSDTVMNVFFIPRLGTQIYAMAGMQTQLHLLAKNPGSYSGISANFSGPGFADMRFSADAVDRQSFGNWVKQTQSNPTVLDMAAFSELERQSQNDPVKYYGKLTPKLFENIVKSDGMKPMQAAE